MNNILNQFQSGHSTISAATLVMNDIVNTIDQGKKCAALFIDLSKAFDYITLHVI